jgi:antitoxin component YwqK of YwqJK toxin-antitoxin module
MRKIFVLLCFLPFFSRAQKLPDYGLNKVRITDTDKTILVEIYPFTNKPTIRLDRLYYWYSANSVHSTQGGFSGKLLNGQYTEYYINKNLKEQGTFKEGLKNGNWKSWNKDGTLNLVSSWKNGKVASSGSVSFWKRLVKRKRKHIAADSLKKTAK